MCWGGVRVRVRVRASRHPYTLPQAPTRNDQATVEGPGTLTRKESTALKKGGIGGWEVRGHWDKIQAYRHCTSALRQGPVCGRDGERGRARDSSREKTELEPKDSRCGTPTGRHFPEGQ